MTDQPPLLDGEVFGFWHNGIWQPVLKGVKVEARPDGSVTFHYPEPAVVGEWKAARRRRLILWATAVIAAVLLLVSAGTWWLIYSYTHLHSELQAACTSITPLDLSAMAHLCREVAP